MHYLVIDYYHAQVEHHESAFGIAQSILMFHFLAGCRQVFFGVFKRSHFFNEQGAEFGTLGIVHLDLRTPLADMMTRFGGHSTCHLGHEPRIAVFGVIFSNSLTGMKTVVAFTESVLEIVARTKGLRSEDVVQVQTFVAAYDSYLYIRTGEFPCEVSNKIP